MRVKIVRPGKPPLVVTDASLMIVEDDNENPISLAYEISGFPGQHRPFAVAHVKDKGFNQALRTLGIDKTVIAEELSGLLLPVEELPFVGTRFPR